MANSPALIKQSEVTRYAKGMKDAGFEKFSIVVKPDGSHVIIAGESDPEAEPNPWDEFLEVGKAKS